MGSRLLPLLALLGAAGLKSSEWEGPPAQEPGTAPEQDHPFAGSAEPRPSSSSSSSARRPKAGSLLASPLPPSLATPADSKVNPARVPSGPTAKKHSSVLGAAGERTQPPTLDSGGIGRTGVPSAVRTSSVPTSPSIATTRSLTLPPKSALLPGSTSPKEVAAPTSGQSSPSGVPEGSTPEGWPATGPSELRGTRGWVSGRATWTWTPEPASGSTAGVSLAPRAASSVGSAEDWRPPAAGGLEDTRPSRAGSWTSPESQTSPHAVEAHPSAPTWPPARDPTDPAFVGSSTPSETPGLEGEAATAGIRSVRPTPSLGTGLDQPSQHPGGGRAHVQMEVTPGLEPEAGTMEPGVAVGPLSPDTALARRGHMPEVTEEAAVSGGTTVGLDSPVSPLRQGAEAVEEALPSPVLPSGATPSSPSPSPSPFSLGAAVHLGLVSPTFHPLGSDHALHGSISTPGPGFPTEHVGPARLPADSTGKPGALDPGQDVQLARTSHQYPTDLPPVSGTGPLRATGLQDSPATATGETRGPPAPPEPFSTGSAQSSPGPTRFPLQGALSGPTQGPAETLAGPAEGGWWVPADSEKDAQKAPATSEAAPPQTSQSAADGTSEGTASAKVQPPVSQTPGRPGSTSQAPGFTGSPVGFETALPPTEGATWSLLLPADSPESGPPQRAVLSTSEAASSRLWWALGQGSPPAGPGQWERRSHPQTPTETSVPATPAPSPHGGGPLQATASSGPLESSWHTWPPASAPEPGSASRGGPAVASTWLLAPVPEESPTRPTPAGPEDANPRGRRVFVAENQPPLLKATFLHVPCELVLAMEFSRSFRNPHSPEYQRLVLSVNETVAPLLASLPGFQRLEVKTIRPGSVVVEFDASFRAAASGLWAALNRPWLLERLPPGLRVADARVLRSGVLERPPDLCTSLFSCRAGYECIAGEEGDAVCTSLCHRDYCQNHGICTHEANHVPVCQCPVGSDFWFLGLRCNYKVTQQGLLGVACGLLLSLAVVGTAIASLVIRRVRMLLLEARADQTKSSYRRFCRLDDVSAHYWSEPWLASASSLDNPAFSNSEELLHLQILDPDYCGCQEDGGGAPHGSCKRLQGTPGIGRAGRPSSHYNWDTSSNSVNDPMIDSGKASEVSVSSWPPEPIQWSPFPALHKLSGQQVDKAQRPHSYCEGMELVNLERSWTA